MQKIGKLEQVVGRGQVVAVFPVSNGGRLYTDVLGELAHDFASPLPGEADRRTNFDRTIAFRHGEHL
jgi:hypothetical protein